MALIPPHFLDCAVAIGTDDRDGKRSWVASGFFYGRRVPSDDSKPQYKVFLVTNRHVVEKLSVAYIRQNPQGNEAAKEFTLPLHGPNGDPIWYPHPREEIDVAVTTVNPTALSALGIELAFFQNDDHIATVSKMEEIGLSEGDGIFVLGFPMGLVGQRRNAVVARVGCLARIRELLDRSAQTFLIDASVFPGNSGGPVISRPETAAIVDTAFQDASYLIGIVSGYIPYSDVAVSAQTGQTRVVFEENSGLAVVYPVDVIEEAIDHLKRLHEQRFGGRPTGDSVGTPKGSV
jgi:S1-C subfamily serine protease